MLWKGDITCSSARLVEENIKADWGLFLKKSDVCSDLMCFHAEHYPIIIWMLNLSLFLDWACKHVLFTVTEVHDEELIRICIKCINTSIGMLRHLYSLSHLPVGFMLYEFSLFILHGTSDVWLDLRMPPRALSRNVNCCVKQILHFATHTVRQLWQISSRRLICFMIMVHSDFLWSHSSGTEVLMHKLSYRHKAH